ncbi:MAG: hypothetical protein WA744_12090 [Candidatus Acidiferrales bacterium]
MPAGPPPAMQQRVWTIPEVALFWGIAGLPSSNHILEAYWNAVGNEQLLCIGGQFSELCIEVGQSAVELFAISRILIGLQLFFYAGTGEQQHLRLPPRFDLGLAELLLIFAIFFGLKFLDLSFDCLAFPSPGHP